MALSGAASADVRDHPALIGALEQVRAHARMEPGPLPWLGLPLALRNVGLTATPLPCLAGGSKAFRLKRVPDSADWLALLRSLEKAAQDGLAQLDRLEALYRQAQRALATEYRPGALPALLALCLHRPLLSPQSVATGLGLSLAGASKLLERGAATGLITEITTRRSWRQFLTSDLAIAYGYAGPKRGRPPKAPAPLPPSRDITALLDAFDQDMANIDKILAGKVCR